MSFLVAHMTKMKVGNLTGIGNHVDRKTDSHSNPDINPSRSHLNYELANREGNFYQDITDYIEKNKATNKAIRKDAVLVNSWVISSDQGFFKTLDQDQQKKFFEESKNYFAGKFGEDNIRYATVHMDETTPHMHMGVIPFDDKKNLSAFRVFNRQTLREIQEDLPKYLQEKGFQIERGIENSEKAHLDTEEFKATMNELANVKKELYEARKEVVETKQECQILLDDRKFLSDKVKSLEIGLKAESKFGSIENYKSVPLTNKVMIERDDLGKLLKRDRDKQVIKNSLEAFKRTLGLSGGAYAQVMKNLRDSENAKIEAQEALEQAQLKKSDYGKLYQSQLELNQQFQKLIAENTSLKQKIKELDQNLNQQIGLTKEISEHLESSYKSFRGVVQAVGMLSYDKDANGRPGEYLAPLTAKQKKLIDSIADYGAKCARRDGFEEVAKSMEKNIGLNKDLMAMMKPAKSRSQDWGMEL